MIPGDKTLRRQNCCGDELQPAKADSVHKCKSAPFAFKR